MNLQPRELTPHQTMLASRAAAFILRAGANDDLLREFCELTLRNDWVQRYGEEPSLEKST